MATSMARALRSVGVAPHHLQLSGRLIVGSIFSMPGVAWAGPMHTSSELAAHGGGTNSSRATLRSMPLLVVSPTGTAHAGLHMSAPARTGADPLVGAAAATAGSSPATPAASFLPGIFSFGDNQFASGGLALMAVGALAALAKRAWDVALELALRRLFMTAELDSRDDAYRWLMHWLSRHDGFAHSPRVSVLTSLAPYGGRGVGALGAADPHAHGAPPGRVLFLPAPGDHVLRFRGRWLWVSRARASPAAQAQSGGRPLETLTSGGRPLETLTVTTWGRSRATLEALLEDAAEAYQDATRARTVVHSVADGYWERVGSRPVRPITSVILPRGQAEAILADCREFLASEPWYAHHGIPHRRGYLLHGAPGSGKTSLVTALAGSLGADVYVVTLSSPSMGDEMLRSLLNSASDRSVLLLEDVDAAFVGRAATAVAGGGSGAAPTTGSLSFSGLLNAIDGVAAQEGRLLFMTTNHIDRLSSALIRPGRVDYRLEFEHADRDQVRRLFLSFFADMHTHSAHLISGASATEPAHAHAHALGSASAAAASPGDSRNGLAAEPADGGHGRGQGAAPHDAGPAGDAARIARAGRLEELASRFADLVPEGCASMAQLQGFLMAHKHDPAAAVDGAAAWLSAHGIGGGAAGGAAEATPTPEAEEPPK
ncbi:hypothetical protein FOA52_007008 [Chlamydomonas sp. UWO 241]|nr:hypothetical protein FOA52_007008 [Chlamydomonas sp. UWO 241]